MKKCDIKISTICCLIWLSLVWLISYQVFCQFKQKINIEASCSTPGSLTFYSMFIDTIVVKSA